MPCARLELAYAILRNRLAPTAAQELYISDGIFAFDNDWKEVYSKPVDVILPLSKSTFDTSSYFTTQHTLHLSPGQYWFAAEVVDRTSLSIGTFKDSLTCTFPTSDFGLSDLLLASHIQSKIPIPQQRSDLAIAPNPLKTFPRSKPVFIYLEMYNLHQNAFGQTRYDISYKIGRPRNQQIDPKLFTAQNLKTEVEGFHQIKATLVSRTSGGVRTQELRDIQITFIPSPKNLINKRELATSKIQTEIASEYQGDQKDDFTFLEIDIQHLPPAIYELTVTAKDQHTQTQIERHTLFKVIHGG